MVSVGILLALGVGQVWAAVAVVAGGRSWWLDLPNHFPQYVAGAWAMSALLWAASARPAGAVASAVVGLVFATRYTLGVVGGIEAGTPTCVTVAFVNVYSANTDTDAVVDWVVAQDADAVGLVEVNQRWIGDLGALRAGWPVHREWPREDNFGMALYARDVGARVEMIDVGSGLSPAMSLTLPAGPTVWLVHPIPPVGARAALDRDATLVDVDRRLAEGGVVVVGDFNATPWSARFPRHGAGAARGTWPAHLPGPLRIPLDHARASAPWSVASLGVGPNLGSDHRPIVARICRSLGP